MKMSQSTLSSFVLLLSVSSQAGLDIRFEENGIYPTEETFLADDLLETCTTFSLDARLAIPTHTQIRVHVPDTVVDELNVTLLGTNLGCGRDLYVSPLSADESEKWTGRWKLCRLLDTSLEDGKESCFYRCRCSGRCQEIQIIKRPWTTNESSWSLCHLCFFYNITDCTFARSNCSGIYHVNVPIVGVTSYTDLYCDMTTDGGGWTVLARRIDGSVNFRREWEDYKAGFGSLTGEFYAGNELVHTLTSVNGHQYSLTFHLEAYDGDRIFAFYTNFSIGPETDNYRLHVGGYLLNSTGGDSLNFSNNMMFSTPNHDNDVIQDVNCATKHSPWWHRSCLKCSTFALYGSYPTVGESIGIKWVYNWGQKKFAKKATMMIRRK